MLCQTASWRPLPQPDAGPGLRIATYNVMNLFGPEHPEGPKPERQLRALAETLLEADADVVALQEVGGAEVLRRFLDEFAGGAYPCLAFARGNDPRGLGLAVLSRHPLGTIREHAHLGFQRDLLAVEVNLPGETFTLLTTHLKSKRGGMEADLQRLQEARQIRELLELESSFLLCGDLNDVPGSPCLSIFLEGPGRELFSAAELLPPTRRATWPTRKAKRQLDFIFMPAGWRRRLRGCRVFLDPRPSDHALLLAEFSQGDGCSGQE